MQFYNTPAGAISGFREAMAGAISDAFKTLLETKHIYQSVTVDEDGATAKFMVRVEAKIKSRLIETGALTPKPGVVPWMIATDIVTIVGSIKNGEAKPHYVFTPPHAKMFCKTSNRVEPFNLIHASADIDVQRYRAPSFKQEQVYTFSYLCQGCKLFPEVVLIRRVNGKLTLSGRSPMEHVEVPAVIPKDIEKFYSGSVIAFQSGQTLPALFMLRTAHEQWARKWATPADKADQALDRYMASLPNDFKDRFPSFKDMYGQISADIHAATGSVELFSDMSSKFVEHFEARRLYKLETPK